MRKHIFILLSVILLFSAMNQSAYAADSAYISKVSGNADITGNFEIPAPYSPVKVYSNKDLGVEAFGNLSDIFYDKEREEYFLCDSSKDICYVFDKNLKPVKSLNGVVVNQKKEPFKNPTSVFVKNNIIYISDTGNQRIVCINNETYDLYKILEKPQIDVLDKDYVYKPKKISVDDFGRVYVISADINKGILQLDENGQFMNFLGAPRVKADPFLLAVKKYVRLKSFLSRLEKFVPAEYDALDIDPKGFIYATSRSSGVAPISEINSQGDNILKWTITQTGGVRDKMHSVDIQLADDGRIFLLDSNTCNIYVYDRTGMPLYNFGGTGEQKGLFQSPASMTLIGDDIAVTDSKKGSVTFFKLTAFGEAINNASYLLSKGKYGLSGQQWEYVLKLSDNYYPAIVGLARIDIQNENYSTALKRLRSIGEKTYYKTAQREIRNDFIRKNFTFLFLGIILVLFLIIIYIRLKTRIPILKRINSNESYRQYKYANYIMFHPFDGYYDLKNENRGSAKTAAIIFIVFIILFAINAQYTGYIVSFKEPGSVNVILNVLTVTIPLFLWGITTWASSTFLEGEANLKEIFISISYALKPYIHISVIMFVLSYIISYDEIDFYNVLKFLALIWVLSGLFFGMMVTNGYNLLRSFACLVMSVIGICVIVFLSLLFFNLISEVVTYFANIFQEINLRYM